MADVTQTEHPRDYLLEQRITESLIHDAEHYYPDDGIMRIGFCTAVRLAFGKRKPVATPETMTPEHQGRFFRAMIQCGFTYELCEHYLGVNRTVYGFAFVFDPDKYSNKKWRTDLDLKALREREARCIAEMNAEVAALKEEKDNA